MERDPPDCTVCFSSCDGQRRKSVSLSCSHEICTSCLKFINNDSSVVCPSCWEMTSFDSSQGTPSPLTSQNDMEESAPMWNERWCLTCGKTADLQCRFSLHSTINAGGGTMSEAAMLQEKYEDCIGIKASIVEKRKQTQRFLDSVLSSIKLVEGEVEKMRRGNGSRLEELESFLSRADCVDSAESIPTFLPKVAHVEQESKGELETVKKIFAGYEVNFNAFQEKFQNGGDQHVKNHLLVLLSFISHQLTIASPFDNPTTPKEGMFKLPDVSKLGENRNEIRQIKAKVSCGSGRLKIPQSIPSPRAVFDVNKTVIQMDFARERDGWMLGGVFVIPSPCFFAKMAKPLADFCRQSREFLVRTIYKDRDTPVFKMELEATAGSHDASGNSLSDDEGILTSSLVGLGSPEATFIHVTFRETRGEEMQSIFFGRIVKSEYVMQLLLANPSPEWTNQLMVTFNARPLL